MSDVLRGTYAGRAELPLLRTKGGRSATTTVLLGAWLGVVEDQRDGWLRVRAFGQEGWVAEADTRSDAAFKLFFIDVGQGDGVLGETSDCRFLVDGGGSGHLRNYLRKWKFRWLIEAGHRVHLDAVFITHFDADHFAGLTAMLADEDFSFGTIYHNGIARFATRRTQRPDDYDTDLGATADGPDGHRATLLTSFSTLREAAALRDRGGLMASFESFVAAAERAYEQGRLTGMKRLTVHSGRVYGFGRLVVDVLGPVPDTANHRHVAWFDDSSHTRNGHSLVLKLTWGERTFLLGGDLNEQSQHHLVAHHDAAPLRVDVAKACHHGSSEFSTEFLAAVSPYLTVISSGDNQNYGHPQPDAVGALGRYSRGVRPLVFSTELARSVSATRIHYGLINVRSDGEMIVGAQMFEQRRRADMWNSFELVRFDEPGAAAVRRLSS